MSVIEERGLLEINLHSYFPHANPVSDLVFDALAVKLRAEKRAVCESLDEATAYATFYANASSRARILPWTPELRRLVETGRAADLLAASDTAGPGDGEADDPAETPLLGDQSSASAASSSSVVVVETGLDDGDLATGGDGSHPTGEWPVGQPQSLWLAVTAGLVLSASAGLLGVTLLLFRRVVYQRARHTAVPADSSAGIEVGVGVGVGVGVDVRLLEPDSASRMLRPDDDRLASANLVIASGDSRSTVPFSPDD
ncbi:unnamed protein product, partial [Protopolystoma xenopodis]